MNLFHPSSQYPLGIDISDKSIKLIQLARRHHVVTIQTAAVANVPKNFIVQGEIKNVPAVVKILQTLTTKTIFGKITSNEVIASLSEEKTFVKLISINVEGKNIPETIEQEIEKHIPYKLEDVNYDWQFIAREKNIQYVLIGVVPKDITTQYYEVLTSADLLPVALEPEPLAIARCILPINQSLEKTTIILKIGATQSSFIACAAKSVLFTMSVPISESNIAGIAAQELQKPWQKTKQTKSNAKKQPATLSIEDVWENKMQQTLNYLKTNYPNHAEIENIYLCYDNASTVDLPKIISKKFHIPAIQGDVFVNLNKHTNIMKKYLAKENDDSKKSKNHERMKEGVALSLATAIGLALRGIYYTDF